MSESPKEFVEQAAVIVQEPGSIQRPLFPVSFASFHAPRGKFASLTDRAGSLPAGAYLNCPPPYRFFKIHRFPGARERSGTGRKKRGWLRPRADIRNLRLRLNLIERHRGGQNGCVEGNFKMTGIKDALQDPTRFHVASQRGGGCLKLEESVPRIAFMLWRRWKQRFRIIWPQCPRSLNVSDTGSRIITGVAEFSNSRRDEKSSCIQRPGRREISLGKGERVYPLLLPRTPYNFLRSDLFLLPRRVSQIASDSVSGSETRGRLRA